MSNSKPRYIERAESLGYHKQEHHLLAGITCWFNGYPLDDGRSIGTDFEPSIERLAEVFGQWDEHHKAAFEVLKEDGLLKTGPQYCAGRRCKWLPTQKGMKVIEDIYREKENYYPPWRREEHAGPPTYRDGNELLEHRKGTLAAYKALKEIPQIDSLELYPVPSSPKEHPDLFVEGEEPLKRVEVITNSNNKQESWRRKMHHWREDESAALWLFSNRKIQAKFWNHLHTQSNCKLVGGTFDGDLNNWSSKRVNERISRSDEIYCHTWSDDCVWTIGGLLRADQDEVAEFLNEHCYKSDNSNYPPVQR